MTDAWSDLFRDIRVWEEQTGNAVLTAIAQLKLAEAREVFETLRWVDAERGEMG